MTDNPLVSIIVRTKDRPKLLRRALQSICVQTYRPIEVVLVNDGGCELDMDELRGILGDVTMNYIRLEKNTGRAHAGNVGIENANGKYIGFLDDDDELYPEHVETIISFLEQSDYEVAYTDIEMVVQEFAPEEGKMVDTNKTIFSKDFSYNDLLVINYIPFNSIIFSKHALDAAGRLDESFELYEDWDFLIRIGQKYPFYHIKKITARYNQWSRDLQINQADIGQMKIMHLQVINKHKEKISPEFILNMWQQSYDKNAIIAEKDGIILQKDSVISEKSEIISQMEKTLAEKDELILQLKNSINSIKATIGWKLLEKFRRSREKLLPSRTMRRRLYDGWVRLLANIIKKKDSTLSTKTNSQIQNLPTSQSGKDLEESSHCLHINDAYRLWILKNEPDNASLEAQRKISYSFKIRPKISIVTPVCNPKKDIFIEMIESVLGQTYDNWELCIADASSNSIRDIINKYISKDRKRIKAVYLSKNKGIAANSNDALTLVTGDFVTFLDHDDTLSPFALFEIVKAINENPDADFIYSDEDKLSEDGKNRLYPHFKPDWSPDKLRSYNYICHLSVFKKELLDKIGYFKAGYEGSQDYDLILRATEKAQCIIHIPKVLYHWRISEKSVAGNPHSKMYAYEAAKKALRDHMTRLGIEARVEDGFFLGSYRVRNLIEKNPTVSIIIPSIGDKNLLTKCVNSILNKTIYKEFEIIIVSSVSEEQKTHICRGIVETDKVRFIALNRNFRLSLGSNVGSNHANGEYLLFLHDDTEIITNDWIEGLLEHAIRKDVGAVGAKLYYPDGRIQHAGLILGIKGLYGYHHRGFPKESDGYWGRLQIIQNLSAVSAACLMISKEKFHELNGFDEEYYSSAYDVDFCLRLCESGFRVVWTPYVELYHHESEVEPMEDKNRFKEKWQEILNKGDPYYSPNLTMDREDFSVKI